MTVRTDTSGASNYVLQSAISAYSEEAYTNAKKLTGTAIIGSDSRIDVSTETYIGQLRWMKPLTPVINVASLTDSTNGSVTTTSSDFAKYIKSVRSHGARNVNLQHVVTQDDGLAKIGRDFSETRAQDEHNAILSVLKGVAIAEVLNGAATGSGATGLGGQTFDNDPADSKYGFYVDVGSNKLVVDATAAIQGAARAQALIDALGMAWKDYEPPFVYAAVSPRVMASFRAANLVDETTIVEGNIEFATMFGGKFRLIPTRANQSFSSAQLTKLNTGAGIDLVGTYTTFLMLPGSIAFQSVAVESPVEIQRVAAAYQGGGTTEIWYRWGYVAHPRGYSWNGTEDAFASDAMYSYVGDTSATMGALTAATIGTSTKGTWLRKTQSALSLGILPVFHS